MKLSDKTKKQILAVVVAIVVFIICSLINKYFGENEGNQAEGGDKAPTEVASEKVTNTPKPTKAADATNTPKPTKAADATNTPKPTKKATSTPKPTKAPTNTPKPTKSATATPKPTKAATATPKPTKATTPSDGRPVYEGDLVFANKSTWESHFEKHGGEFDGLYKTKEEYVAGANKVIHNPKSLYKTEKEDGDHIFYLEETNEFVVVATFGKIRTYFKPSGGKKYFDRQ